MKHRIWGGQRYAIKCKVKLTFLTLWMHYTCRCTLRQIWYDIKHVIASYWHLLTSWYNKTLLRVRGTKGTMLITLIPFIGGVCRLTYCRTQSHGQIEVTNKICFGRLFKVLHLRDRMCNPYKVNSSLLNVVIHVKYLSCSQNTLCYISICMYREIITITIIFIKVTLYLKYVLFYVLRYNIQ